MATVWLARKFDITGSGTGAMRDMVFWPCGRRLERREFRKCKGRSEKGSIFVLESKGEEDVQWGSELFLLTGSRIDEVMPFICSHQSVAGSHQT